MADQECDAGKAMRWEDTGGKPAAMTGADRQRQQARLIRRRGTGAAMRKGKNTGGKPAAVTEFTRFKADF